MERLTVARDRAFGRFFAKRGASRVLKEAEECRPNRERIAHWRIQYANIPIEQTIAPKRHRR
jgi:hypothetical protein